MSITFYIVTIMIAIPAVLFIMQFGRSQLISLLIILTIPFILTAIAFFIVNDYKNNIETVVTKQIMQISKDFMYNPQAMTGAFKSNGEDIIVKSDKETKVINDSKENPYIVIHIVNYKPRHVWYLSDEVINTQEKRTYILLRELHN